MHERITISVWVRTRNKIKLLAAYLGVTMAEAVDRAVTKLLEVTEQTHPNETEDKNNGN